jgi:AcrR family transcriptional regulator
MGRPRVHDARTRTDLIRAALVLVAKSGQESVSVRALAAKLGTTTRAIYSVFGSKDGVFDALLRESFHALTRAVDAVPLTDDPMHDLVRAGVDGFRRYALTHPNLFRFVFEGPPLRMARPENQGVAMECLNRLRHRVERCAAAGLLPAGSIDTVTTSFHALCQGLASVERTGCLPLPAGNEPEAVWELALRALVDGFSAAPANRIWPRSPTIGEHRPPAPAKPARPRR